MTYLSPARAGLPHPQKNTHAAAGLYPVVSILRVCDLLLLDCFIFIQVHTFFLFHLVHSIASASNAAC